MGKQEWKHFDGPLLHSGSCHTFLVLPWDPSHHQLGKKLQHIKILSPFLGNSLTGSLQEVVQFFDLGVMGLLPDPVGLPQLISLAWRKVSSGTETAYFIATSRSEWHHLSITTLTFSCLTETEKCCTAMTHKSCNEFSTSDLQHTVPPFPSFLRQKWWNYLATLANWQPSTRLPGVPKLVVLSLTPFNNVSYTGWAVWAGSVSMDGWLPD